MKLLFYLFPGGDGEEESSGRKALHFLRRLVPRAMFLKVMLPPAPPSTPCPCTCTLLRPAHRWLLRG